MTNYDGKDVVIIGGTSGMGLATTKLLIEHGSKVLVTGRTDESVAAAQQEVRSSKLSTAVSNAASLQEIEKLAVHIKNKFGTIDALIITAGSNSFVPFEMVSEDVYDNVVANNLKGPYFTAQKLAPLVKKGGAIVFVTSAANVLGIPMISAYAAAKAGLRSLTRSAARELLPRGIRVNAVSPGPIDTGILDRSLPPEAAAQTKKQMTQENPMKRFGRPEEIAKALLFLAFEATYTTGAELAVDGGGTQL